MNQAANVFNCCPKTQFFWLGVLVVSGYFVAKLKWTLEDLYFFWPHTFEICPLEPNMNQIRSNPVTGLETSAMGTVRHQSLCSQVTVDAN